jgi:hypothetical protein
MEQNLILIFYHEINIRIHLSLRCEDQGENVNLLYFHMDS